MMLFSKRKTIDQQINIFNLRFKNVMELVENEMNTNENKSMHHECYLHSFNWTRFIILYRFTRYL